MQNQVQFISISVVNQVDGKGWVSGQVDKCDREVAVFPEKVDPQERSFEIFTPTN